MYKDKNLLILNTYSKSTEGLIERQILSDKQISPLPLEQFVVLLLDDKIDVTGFHVRNFIAHTGKRNLLIVAHSLVNVNFQNLSLRSSFRIVTLSSAGIALALHLSDHSRSNLPNFHDSTLTIALGTPLDFSDNDLAVDGQLDRLSIVEIFEGYFERMVDAGALARSRATTSTTSEKHGKQVFSRVSMTVIANALFEL
jgi:hypothetical protein